MSKFRVVGICFDHMHMGDLLRQVDEHSEAEIAAVFDPNKERMAGAIETFAIDDARVFDEFDACMNSGPYDLAILCAATADHERYTQMLGNHPVRTAVTRP